MAQSPSFYDFEGNAFYREASLEVPVEPASPATDKAPFEDRLEPTTSNPEQLPYFEEPPSKDLSQEDFSVIPYHTPDISAEERADKLAELGQISPGHFTTRMALGTLHERHEPTRSQKLPPRSVSARRVEAGRRNDEDHLVR